MEKKKLKIDKKMIRSSLAIMILIVIVLFASYSYYSGVKALRNVNITINANQSIYFIYDNWEDLAYEFYADDLVQTDKVIDDKYYGYLESDPVYDVMSGTANDTVPITCNYELWYNPDDAFTSTYEEGVKKLSLIGEYVVDGAISGNDFEFDITNITERTKIMDSFFNFYEEGDVVWKFKYRLYDLVDEENSFDSSAGGKVEIISNGCERSNLYFDREDYSITKTSSLRDANNNTINDYDKSGKIKFINNSPNDDISIQTFGPIEAHIDNGYLVYQRTGVERATIIISNNHGGHDSLVFVPNVEVNFNNTMSSSSRTLFDEEYDCDKEISITKNRNGEYLVDLGLVSAHSTGINNECNVKYEKKEIELNSYFNEYIKKLVDTTSEQTDWQVKKVHHEVADYPEFDFDDIKYTGENPNNYVWFNNEYWRVIGVVGYNHHGLDKELVKLVRNVPVGDYSMGDNYFSSFYGSNIMNYLNNYYYYHDVINDIYTRPYSSIDGVGQCGSYNFHCGFLNGIKDPTSFRMIESIKHYNQSYQLGNYDFSDDLINVDMISFADISNGDENDTLNWIGEFSWIWLKEVRKAGNSFYPCLLDPRTDKIDCSSFNRNNYAHSVFPVVYLKDDVYLLDGDGTMANPYILGLDWGN